MMDHEPPIYKTGFHGLVRTFEMRRQPFENTDLVLPPAQVDLAALWNCNLDTPAASDTDNWRNDAQQKYNLLHRDLVGEPQLFLLHAMLIAILRRAAPPADAITLFFRIWREHGDDMARTLPVRWLISAATTFGDHGRNAAQQSGGLGLSMLFDLIKLHDSERRVSGRRNDRAFRHVKGRIKHSLAFDMQPYALAQGDLDRIMLARLWKICESDTVLRPLGIRMLRLVISDRRSIFARVGFYRNNKKNRDEKPTS